VFHRAAKPNSHTNAVPLVNTFDLHGRILIRFPVFYETEGNRLPCKLLRQSAHLVEALLWQIVSSEAHMIAKAVARSAATNLRRVANAVGFDFRRYSKWQWSYNVEAYYPVEPSPRWGYGKPCHPQITKIFAKQREEFATLLDGFSQHTELFASIPMHGDPSSKTPNWNNGFFEYLDAASLVSILLSNSPRLYLEIGSGNSTKFARHAIDSAKLETRIISVDPEPRAQINSLCDEIIRQRLEECDLTLFDQLEPGDILFFDGSHRLFTNSDVTVFFLELMPRLKAGTIVHIHDIFLPLDYPPAWSKRMYSEQYMLATMLLCPQPSFKVLLPNCFVCNDADLQSRVESFLVPAGWAGGSFWIKTV
jgi:hypothetical protein